MHNTKQHEKEFFVLLYPFVLKEILMHDLGLTGIKSFLACSPDVHRSVKFPTAFLLTVQYRKHYYFATAELLLFCCRGSAMYVMSVACVLKRVSGFPSCAVGLQTYSHVPFFLRDLFAT